ncbi:histone-like nucleoid-structuring protein Lsr2 [Kitasatospora sp. NPDC056184]|uniref:Lsr2 family DNA-binding protein n=1 Tax=Kitasatospora sp. NPDC056184 TaxID=3345738 RepID=UPI0035DBACE5
MEDEGASNIMKVVQVVTLDVNGTTYKGEVDDPKVIKDLQAKSEAYEKALQAVEESIEAAGLAVERPQQAPVQQARSNGGRQAGSAGSGRTSEENDAIRAWAREHGFPNVKAQGRVPRNIVEAYEAAHTN